MLESSLLTLSEKVLLFPKTIKLLSIHIIAFSRGRTRILPSFLGKPLILTPSSSSLYIPQKAEENRQIQSISIATQPKSYQADYLYNKMKRCFDKLSQMELEELRIKGRFFDSFFLPFRRSRSKSNGAQEGSFLPRFYF